MAVGTTAATALSTFNSELSTFRPISHLPSPISDATKSRLLVDAAGEGLSYDDLLARVRQVRRLGRVCRSANLAELFAHLVAAMLHGRRLLLVDPQLTERELQSLEGADDDDTGELPAADIANATALIAACAAGSEFELELLTSGSTGLPKRVSHGLAGLTRALRTGPRHAHDVWGFCYNPTHIAGVQVFLQAFLNGNALVNLFPLSPAEIARQIRAQGVTHLSATPTFYRLLLGEGGTPFERVQAVTLGGEASDPALLGRLRVAFPAARIRNLYASTEHGTLLTSEGDVFTIPESLRSAVKIEANTLRLHRSLLGEFHDATPGPESGVVKPETGKLKAQGDGLKAEQTQRSAFSVSDVSVSAFSSDWYDTGDAVAIESELPLRFRFVGRERDWINIGGEKVNPSEIEAELLQCPGVTAARVFGRKSSVVGQLLAAEVVVRGETDEQAIRDFLAGRLAKIKVPRFIAFVSELPMGRTGKRAAARGAS